MFGKLGFVKSDEFSFKIVVINDHCVVAGQPHPPPSPKPSSPRPGSSGRYSRTASRSGSTLSRPASGFSRVDPEPDIEVADTGRKDDMPSCPIIFVMGVYKCHIRFGYRVSLVKIVCIYFVINPLRTPQFMFLEDLYK